jgi:hypothetical protein
MKAVLQLAIRRAFVSWLANPTPEGCGDVAR